MSSGYAKVHQTILDSSIWSEPHATRIVWITMLAMADADGVVSASVSGLARRAVVTREECEAALETFLAPDPDSSDGTSGERIERVRGGWRILNHGHYRRLGSQEDRKEKARDRAARSYAKKSAEKRREAQPLASASASVSASASEGDQGQDWNDARAPVVRIVGEDPPALVRLREGYQARYESATQDAWMGAAGAHRHLATIAEWAERQAALRSRAVAEVIAEWLDALFALERLRPHRWPLKWAAEDPAAVLAEATRPARADPAERQRLEEQLEEELSRIRYESREHVLGPAQKRIAAIRERLGDVRSA